MSHGWTETHLTATPLEPVEFLGSIGGCESCSSGPERVADSPLAAERHDVSPLNERATAVGEELMKAPPLVETARLVLSAPVAADAEAVFRRYASDDDVTRYLGWPKHRTVADTQGFLAFSAVQWEREGAGPYLIWARADGQLLGSTGLGLEPGGQAITGYVLATDAWGKGYATEALTAVVEVATDIGVRRLYASVSPAAPSIMACLGEVRLRTGRSWNRQVEFPNIAAGITQDVLCYRRGLHRHAG